MTGESQEGRGVGLSCQLECGQMESCPCHCHLTVIITIISNTILWVGPGSPDSQLGVADGIGRDPIVRLGVSPRAPALRADRWTRDVLGQGVLCVARHPRPLCTRRQRTSRPTPDFDSQECPQSTTVSSSSPFHAATRSHMKPPSLFRSTAPHPLRPQEEGLDCPSEDARALPRACSFLRPPLYSS